MEAAWNEEIKRRVDDIRSGRVKTIPGGQLLGRLKTGSGMSDDRDYRFHPLAWQELEEAAIAGTCRTVAREPRRWPKYLHGTRRFVMQRFPFSVIYLDDPDVVTSIVTQSARPRSAAVWWAQRGIGGRGRHNRELRPSTCPLLANDARNGASGLIYKID